MKKIFLFIFCVGLITALRGQPVDRESMQLSTFVGYPLTVGDNNDANKQIAFNRLLPMNVELDSMARYQIGAIPDQTVWHEGEITVGFYVLTDTLQSTNVTLNYSVDFPPEGKITFDENTGRFKYFPDKFDVRNFTITFTAQSGSKIITQDVKFTLMAAVSPEYAAFGVEPVKPMPPSTDDYTIIAQTIRRNVKFNNSVRDTVRSISITGKELVFDSQIQNKVRYLTGQSDIEELNLFAEKVIIREALHFPQTNITIYAKELIFVDTLGRQASINTSPVMWDIPENINGNRGENAGNITLYIKEYKQTKPHKRFILIGGKGQNVFWDTEGAEWMPGNDRTPGNGGNGGTLTSTIDVNDFCDVIHGSSGVQLNRNNHIISTGQHGNDGSFVLYDKEFTWLHPNFISAVVKHAKDAYLNVYNGFTHNIFSEYTQRITDLKASEEWEELDDEAKMELNNAENEMQAIIYRIGQNLDYFGNPVGWVPMLSFEVNKMAFEQEIEKAIRVMYLNYWLKKIDAGNEQYLDACNAAIQLVKQDLADNKELITQLVRLIPELQDEATELERQIEELVIKIEQKTQELLAKAKDNIKKREQWGVVCGVLSGVAKVAPVVCSVIPGVGTAAGVLIGSAISAGTNALAKATNANTTYMAYGEAIGSFAATTGEFFRDGGFAEISKTLNQINFSDLGAGLPLDTAYNRISKTVDPLVKGVDKLHKALTQNSTPNDQVQAELDRLKAESKEYQALIAESEVLNTRKAQMMSKMANTISYATATSVEIQKNITKVDGLGRNVFNNNSKRDLRALQYLDDMDRRAIL